MEGINESVQCFLANKVYLPGYMTLRKEDYNGNSGFFSFDVKEPLVARGNIVHYVTPRGLHICISQAGYALTENMAKDGRLGEQDVKTLRETLLQGRVKIIELNERFRKEIRLGGEIQGKFEILRYRMGKLPMIEFSFDFDNRAISGSLISVIAPAPVTSLNSNVTRF